MKSILDRSFKYVPAAKTNLTKTFARIRKQQSAARKESEPVVRYIGRSK